MYSVHKTLTGYMSCKFLLSLISLGWIPSWGSVSVRAGFFPLYPYSEGDWPFSKYPD